LARRVLANSRIWRPWPGSASANSTNAWK
jgi:hypothetical protein